MKPEISSGILIFKEKDGKREYLLLHYPSLKKDQSYWDFPKGHLEEKETAKEAAIREVKEETGIGIENLILIDGFKKEIKYYFKKDNKLVFKIVYYFLAKTLKEEVEISSEHLGYRWASPQEAKKLIKFSSSRKLIDEAEEFLNKKPS
jgi:8-oxo-dGTP pyrophosphatase MutT (NUDIX family)